MKQNETIHDTMTVHLQLDPLFKVWQDRLAESNCLQTLNLILGCCRSKSWEWCTFLQCFCHKQQSMLECHLAAFQIAEPCWAKGCHQIPCGLSWIWMPIFKIYIFCLTCTFNHPSIHALLLTPSEPSRGAMTWATLAQSVCLSALLATKDSITPLKAIWSTVPK